MQCWTQWFLYLNLKSFRQLQLSKVSPPLMLETLVIPEHYIIWHAVAVQTQLAAALCARCKRGHKFFSSSFMLSQGNYLLFSWFQLNGLVFLRLNNIFLWYKQVFVLLYSHPNRYGLQHHKNQTNLNLVTGCINLLICSTKNDPVIQKRKIIVVIVEHKLMFQEHFVSHISHPLRWAFSPQLWSTNPKRLLCKLCMVHANEKVFYALQNPC